MNHKTITKYFPLVKYILQQRSVSRAQLAHEFHYNTMTAGNIAERLLTAGAIKESGIDEPESPQVGRPPIALSINERYGSFIGINFNSRELSAVLVDFAGNVRGSFYVLFSEDPDKDEVIDAIDDAVSSLRADFPDDRIIAIGVGSPGVVDYRRGIGLTYQRIRKWDNVPLSELLYLKFRLPVFVDQNCNCFAIGEALLGIAKTCASAIVLVVGAGVAMGVVNHGEIFRSSNVSAGEIGHTNIGPHDRQCWCGNSGCLEAGVSGWRLEQELANAGFDAHELDSFWARVNAGDGTALKIIAPMFHYLGIAVVDIARLFRPEVVIVTGIMNQAPELLRRAIDKEFSERWRALNNGVPKVVISPNDRTKGASGSAMMAYCRQFES